MLVNVNWALIARASPSLSRASLELYMLAPSESTKAKAGACLNAIHLLLLLPTTPKPPDPPPPGGKSYDFLKDRHT